MVAKSTANLFVGKNVSIERVSAGTQIFSKGTLTEVLEHDLILKHNGFIQAYSLVSIMSIREECD